MDLLHCCTSSDLTCQTILHLIMPWSIQNFCYVFVRLWVANVSNFFTKWIISRSVKNVDRKRILFQSILFDRNVFHAWHFFLMNVISFAGMVLLLKLKNILNFKWLIQEAEPTLEHLLFVRCHFELEQRLCYMWNAILYIHF